MPLFLFDTAHIRTKELENTDLFCQEIQQVSYVFREIVR